MSKTQVASASEQFQRRMESVVRAIGAQIESDGKIGIKIRYDREICPVKPLNNM